MTTNWLATIGKIDVTDKVISHVPSVAPSEATTEPGLQQPPLSLAKSNIEFETGAVRFEAYLQDSSCRCQLVLNGGHESEVFVGLNVINSAYGISTFKRGQWEILNSAAFGDHPAPQRWIPIEVRVQGSNVQLYISGVKVCVASHPILRSQLGILFQGNMPVKVRNFAADSTRPTVFVVMQFTDEYNVLFEEVIKPTCESFGYSVQRGDDPNMTGSIIEDLTKAIREASVIIADITPDNPNVFYEVGYSHALAKPTILLSDRKRVKLPFDVSGFRTLFYDNTIGGKRAVEESLQRHLQSLAA